MAAPETRYARSGDLHIAYQTVGDGPQDLVFVHGWISHIEHVWEEPSVARCFPRLASFTRLILLDKRGTGMSDPVPLDRLPTLEERMDDVRAVMDAAGSPRATLFGTSEAGALNLLFSATHPDRTAALILLNSYARIAWAQDYPWGIPADAAGELLKSIEAGWGQGVAFEALVASEANDPAMRAWWARYQRLAASPGAAVTLLRRAYDTDARSVLSAIRVPTLILHRANDPFSGPEHGRYLAERIAGARYVELSGVDHVLFASFDGPARAIRCAVAINRAVRPLGIAVRVGLHTGECEVIGDKVGGIAVHIGARVATRAGEGEVLVSSTVRDLVAGSGIEFDDRGVQTLKGVPGDWRLFAVRMAA